MTTVKQLSGTNTLLIGEPGSGKTSSLPTFIRAGVELNIPLKLAVIITEPGGDESLLDGMRIHATKGTETLPLDRLIYKYIPPTAVEWSALIEMAKKVNLMGYKDLAEQKTGLARDKHRGLLDLLSCLANFVDDRTGKSFGAVDDFDTTWMLAIDSLTGVNNLADKLHVGLKPTKHMGEWGVVMQTEQNLIDQLIAVTKCFTCITGHVDKEMDELIGKPQFMPAMLGKKLAPKVPRLFSDVVLQYKEPGPKYKWSTNTPNYSCLKARNVADKDNLPPDFTPIVKSWLKRRDLTSIQEKKPIIKIPDRLLYPE